MEEREEVAVDADTEVPAGTEEIDAEQEEKQEEPAGAEPSEKTGDDLPKDAPEWAVKRFGKLTAKRHAAEEAKALAEAERDQYKSEAEKAMAKYGDRDILGAAKRVGMLPELMTADEAKLLTQADTLKNQVDRLEAAADDYPEGYDSEDGKHVTPQQIRSWLRSSRNELAEIADEAAALRKTKADELREIIRLGKAAKAGAGRAKGEKAGGTPAVPGKPPVKAKPTLGAESPETAASPRRAATAGTAREQGDLSKVKSASDLVSFFTKKYGG